MKPLLDITDVSLSYHSLSGETPALSHISFQLMPGEFLAIVGPSGCGKSTLLNLICGLLRPEQGQILLDGTPVTSGDCRIGYMLQKDHLLEWRTIYKNVLLGLEIRRELTAEKLALSLPHYGNNNLSIVSAQIVPRNILIISFWEVKLNFRYCSHTTILRGVLA